MRAVIRKISVGKDFPNGCIHYQVGKTVSGRRGYTISDIVLDREALSLGSIIYNIYIQSDSETIFWKGIKDMPVVYENDLGFQ